MLAAESVVTAKEIRVGGTFMSSKVLIVLFTIGFNLFLLIHGGNVPLNRVIDNTKDGFVRRSLTLSPTLLS